MAKKQTRKAAKHKKRGPKEERLKIEGDPAAALTRLINAPKPR